MDDVSAESESLARRDCLPYIILKALNCYLKSNLNYCKICIKKNYVQEDTIG